MRLNKIPCWLYTVARSRARRFAETDSAKQLLQHLLIIHSRSLMSALFTISIY